MLETISILFFVFATLALVSRLPKSLKDEPVILKNYPINNQEEDYINLYIKVQQSKDENDLRKTFNLLAAFQFKYGDTLEGQVNVNSLISLYEEKETGFIMSEILPYTFCNS